jgi:cytoskeletal protein RodZ
MLRTGSAAEDTCPELFFWAGTAWTARSYRAILTSVSIGETLAGARSRAGLTIADVSVRTRIREALVRAIEHDDFAACGADVYARGHIRAIAAVVNVDADELISQYDAAHPSGRPPTLADLPRRPPVRQRRRRNRTPALSIAVVLVLAVIGFAAYKLVSGVTGAQRLTSSSAAAVTRARTSPTRQPASRQRSPGPSGRPTPSVSPTALPVSDVTPVSATAFGSGGPSDGDNPQEESLALSGNPATAWHTDWYATPTFASMATGTGLLLDLGRPLWVTGASIQLGATPGADFQLRAGTDLADLVTVTSESDAGGLVRLRLASPVRAQYLLIWFTLLPPDGAGTYQADVSAVTATVTP